MTPRIGPIDPPYPPEVQAEFDKLMRGAPPLDLFRTVARDPRVLQRMMAGSLLHRGSRIYRLVFVDFDPASDGLTACVQLLPWNSEGRAKADHVIVIRRERNGDCPLAQHRVRSENLDTNRSRVMGEREAGISGGLGSVCQTNAVDFDQIVAAAILHDQVDSRHACRGGIVACRYWRVPQDQGTGPVTQTLLAPPLRIFAPRFDQELAGLREQR